MTVAGGQGEAGRQGKRRLSREGALDMEIFDRTGNRISSQRIAQYVALVI